MPLGMIGKKIGMTQVNTSKDERVPVTLLEVGPCLIMEKKSPDKHGYSALKLAFGLKKAKNTKKPLRDAFEKKLKTEPREFIREFRIAAADLEKYEEGKEIRVEEVFQEGQIVDVSGNSKGRGFTGVVKKYGMGGQSRTHGTHEHFRHGGSIGMNSWPGHVQKNMKMPGQHGNQRRTTLNLEVIKILPEKNCIAVRGAVPGAGKGVIEIRPAVKVRLKKETGASA